MFSNLKNYQSEIIKVKKDVTDTDKQIKAMNQIQKNEKEDKNMVKEIYESEYEDSSDEGLIPRDARARKAQKERQEADKMAKAL